MLKKKSLKYWICCMTLMLSLFACTTPIFARAGGGSSGGESNHSSYYNNSRSNGGYIGGFVFIIASSGFIFLLSQWEAKSEWMKYKYEQNVLENIYLIDKKIIYLHNDNDDSKDSFFAYILGRMKDSTIDTLSKLTIEKDTSIFEEYWRFLRIGDTFYLDAIFQEDEININEFGEDE